MVAIELHQRIPVHDDRHDAREHQNEVGPIVEKSVRGSPPPNGRSNRTNDQLCPDAREGNDHPLVARRHHDAFGCIRVKSRSEIHQRESHGRHTAAIMLTSMCVPELMSSYYEHTDYIEKKDIVPGFISEIVKIYRIPAYFAPMRDCNSGGK